MGGVGSNIYNMPSLWLIFLTGLLTGGITCMAVQGGLLTATVAARVKGSNDPDTKVGFAEVGIFLVAKLVAHILVGAILGLIGSAVVLNPRTSGIFQGLIGIYMLGVAGAMLDVHPFFRRFVIQTPGFLKKFIRSTSKSGNFFAPAVLGAATIFIPCGITQAMMALAVSSGSPMWGAGILGSFVLGTSPLFLAFGLVLSKFGDLQKQIFLKVAGVVVLGMALLSINSALVLNGSRVTAQKLWQEIKCTISYCEGNEVLSASTPADEITVTFNSYGYATDKKVVKAGSKIKLNLVNKGGYGCVQAFTIPTLGISQLVPPGTQKTVELTVPTDQKELAFACSMGMYEGRLAIVN